MSTFARRLLLCSLAVAGVGLLIYAVNTSTAGDANTSLSKPDYVLRLIPDSGSSVLRQASVGVQVQVGYDAYLVINGTEIQKVAGKIGDDGLEKTDSLGMIQYTPGPGKTIESLNAQQNTVIAYIWKQSDGQSTAKPVAWTFNAT